MALTSEDKGLLSNAILTYIDEFAQDRPMDLSDAVGVLWLVQDHLARRTQRQMEHEAASRAVAEALEEETGNTDTHTPDSPDGFLPPQPWSPDDDDDAKN